MMGAFLFGQIPLFVEEFARGGGGGSGGSGSGSGGGGLLYIIALIGYLPMHLVGRKLRQRFYQKPGWVAAQVVLWVSAIAIALALVIIFAALKTFTGEFYVALPVGIGAVVGAGAGLYNWFTKLTQSKATKAVLDAASKQDGAWNEAGLTEYAKNVFLRYQSDWSTFNTDSMKTYLTANYYNHSLLMMYALKGANRVNQVVDPVIDAAVITDAYDATDNTQDRFTVGITAKANDMLVDTRTNTLLFQDNNQFEEFWHFARTEKGWLFDGITQGTENLMKERGDIKQFAAQHGLYYSTDWGWLLLPSDGYLFKNGKFGVSDINNHVIGVVNNVLTQLYTYLQVGATNPADQYLILQTNVPKTYGRILVRRKSGLINIPVKGLTHIKMEWGEFNNLYDVYASDLERVTSFELLNPAFMAVLRDLPFEVSIEVVDNVVYLFTKSRTDVSHYAAMYDVLLKAHKEMKL